VEATIQTCRRADPENAASYDKIYLTYHNEVAQTARSIGFLVGREAHLNGVEKETLFDSVRHLTETVMQDVERGIELDSKGFIDLCHDLPSAAAANVGLFAPLTQRVPQEMDIIQQLDTIKEFSGNNDLFRDAISSERNYCSVVSRERHSCFASIHWSGSTVGLMQFQELWIVAEALERCVERHGACAEVAERAPATAV
jgi:hypothetical protein